MNKFIRKISIIILLIVLQFMIYLNIAKVNADDEVDETWDISGDSSSNVTATLYKNGKLVISGTGKIQDFEIIDGKPNTPYYGKDILEVEIQNGITYIGKYSFRSCTKLTKVVISANIEEIGEESFRSCTSLQEINIPNSTQKIDKYAFIWCSKIESINIPSNVVTLEENPFAACYKLKNINIENGNNNFIFEDGILTDKSKTRIISCTASKEGICNIYETVTKIDGYAFFDRDSLQEINIPVNVEQIGESPFSHCGKLTGVKIDQGNQSFIMDKGILYDNAKTRIIICSKDQQQENYEIPSTVLEIDSGAFYYCDEIKNVVLPDNITNIYFYTFANCNKLENITLPSELKEIGKNAFYSCSSLQEINIPNGVKSIGVDALCNCDSLQELNLPSSLQEIGNNAISYCDKLSSVRIDQNNQNFIMENGILYNKEKTRIIICSRDQQEQTYNIPSTVEKIDNAAFFKCNTIKSIELSDKITIISSGLCSNCSALESITIPNNLTEIGSNAFYSCSSLQEINIPNSVKSIGIDALYNCDSLQELNLPSSLQEIGNNAISYCDKLSSVRIDQNNQNFIMENGILYNKEKTRIIICSRDQQEQTYNIPSTVEKIDNAAFFKCNTIKSIELSDKITIISSGLFSNCSALESITIPNGLTEIGSNAFYNCSSLQGIDIPINTKKIGISAFCNCRSLKQISIPKNIENFGNNVFNGCEFTKVYIPSKHTTYATENNLPYEIDDNGPQNVNVVSHSDKTKNTLEVTAADNQSGLYKYAYSFDNGQTWQESNEKTYTQNTNGIIVKARDKIGNETQFEQTINIIDIEKVVKSISIKQNPNKLEYVKGERLDLTGLVLEAEYMDNTKENITSGFTADKDVLDTVGTVKITISYKNHNATFNVNVTEQKVEKKLKSINIKQKPNKLEYTKGERIDLTGMVLEAEYEDGSKENITSGFTADKDVLDTVGTIKITISYNNVSTSFNVNVTENKKDEDDDEKEEEEDRREEDEREEDRREEEKREEDKREEDKREEEKREEKKEYAEDPERRAEESQQAIEDISYSDTADESIAAKNTITNLSKGKLPNTGLVLPIGIIISITLAVITCVGYIKYNKLK